MTKTDFVCISVILLSALALRAPLLDVPFQNVDEHEYRAKASYLISSNISSFSAPYGPIFMTVVYKQLGLIFGSDLLLPVRWLQILLSMVMGLMIFYIVRMMTDAWFGLLAGVVFLHFSFCFSPMEVNREWFASPVLLLGIILNSNASENKKSLPMWQRAAGGFLCGVSLWFKLQALPMLFAVPAVLLYEGWSTTNMKRAGKALLWYCMGLILAIAAYAAPFLLAGTLDERLRLLMEFTFHYTGVANINLASTKNWSLSSIIAIVYYGFYRNRLFPAIFIVTFLYCVYVIVSEIFDGIRKGPSKSSPAQRSFLLIWIAYLATSMFTIQLGGRFYEHYFQFLAPPVAALLTCSAYYLFNLKMGYKQFYLLVPACVFTLYCGIGMHAPDYIKHQSHAYDTLRPGFIICGLVLLGLECCGRMPEWGRQIFKWVSLAFLGCVLLNLVFHTQYAVWKNPPVKPREKSALENYFVKEGRKGDRLFVWGWRPEIYTRTALSPASQFTSISYLLRDYVRGQEKAVYDSQRLEALMKDLNRTVPRFIVDASKISLTHGDATNMQLAFCQPFADFVRAGYESAGDYSGCRVYVKR